MRYSLDPRRRALLRAVVDCMLPADREVGGWEAGVGDFIEQMLGRELRPRREELELGLEALDEEAGGAFTELSDTERISLLQRIEAGRQHSVWPIEPPAFVAWIAALCAQGYYGDPGNGGNRAEASWRSIGYRLLPVGRQWPAPEAALEPVVTIDDVDDRYDVVVVGAGAGGGIAAQVLSEAGPPRAARGARRGAVQRCAPPRSAS